MLGSGSVDTYIVTSVGRLNGHGKIRCVTQLDNTVFSGGEDGCVRLWDAQTVRLDFPDITTAKMTFDLQKDVLRKIDFGYPVLSLLSVATELWVGTSNGVKILKKGKNDQFKLLATLPVQTRAIKDMIICEELEDDTEDGLEQDDKEKPPQPQHGEIRVWTASDDNTICVWRLNASVKKFRADSRSKKKYVTHLATLRGHGGRVLCLQRVGAQVWSGGSFDNLIFLWDAKSLNYVGELGGTHYTDIVRAIVKIDNNTVWTGSLDEKNPITIWKRNIPLPD